MANSTRLTITITPEILALAHALAESDNTSIAKMFSEFILTRTNQKKRQWDFTPGPLLKAATGLLKKNISDEYKKEMENIIEEKYQAIK